MLQHLIGPIANIAGGYLKNKAEEKTVWEPTTTRDPNEPNKPSEKGGYKRRRRRSTKKRRRSTKKRRRTMRR